MELFFPHIPSLPFDQERQSLLLQPFVLTGQEFASHLTDIPALSLIVTLMPLDSRNFEQISFSFVVRFPAVGLIIIGADSRAWFLLW